MNCQKIRQAVSNYLDEINDVYKLCGIDKLDKADVENKLLEIGLLRDKYKQNGRVDFTIEEVAQAIEQLKFAISNLILFFNTGLTDFEFQQTEYGPRGFFEGRGLTRRDQAFFYFVDDTFERLYGFWNRIAYFLNIFFKLIPETEERKILFPIIIDKLSKIDSVNCDKSFQCLKKFKDNEYTKFNQKREKIVHKEYSSSTYFIEAIKNIPNINELRHLQQERDDLPNFFLVNFERAIQGIDEVVSLVKNNISI